jgi:hypothetical protein
MGKECDQFRQETSLLEKEKGVVDAKIVISS